MSAVAVDVEMGLWDSDALDWVPFSEADEEEVAQGLDVDLDFDVLEVGEKKNDDDAPEPGVEEPEVEPEGICRIKLEIVTQADLDEAAEEEEEGRLVIAEEEEANGETVEDAESSHSESSKDSPRHPNVAHKEAESSVKDGAAAGKTPEEKKGRAEEEVRWEEEKEENGDENKNETNEAGSVSDKKAVQSTGASTECSLTCRNETTSAAAAARTSTEVAAKASTEIVTATGTAEATAAAATAKPTSASSSSRLPRCAFCRESFSAQRSLRRHVKRKHFGEVMRLLRAYDAERRAKIRYVLYKIFKWENDCRQSFVYF